MEGFSIEMMHGNCWVFSCARHFCDEDILLHFDIPQGYGTVKEVPENLVFGNVRPINLLNCPSHLSVNWLPIVILHPEEAAEQVGEEDEAMGEYGTGDMEEFREDGLDGPRTADDQDCFSKYIVVRALKTKSPEGMRTLDLYIL